MHNTSITGWHTWSEWGERRICPGGPGPTTSPSKDIQATKRFFNQAFGWSFQDFGPEYAAFSNQGIDGGFCKSELSSSTKNGAALVVLYSQNLEQTQEKIKNANGMIVKPIFSFPGGRRFHFTEPGGNEFAVWSEENSWQGIVTVQIFRCALHLPQS